MSYIDFIKEQVEALAKYDLPARSGLSRGTPALFLWHLTNKPKHVLFTKFNIDTC